MVGIVASVCALLSVLAVLAVHCFLLFGLVWTYNYELSVTAFKVYCCSL